MIAFGDYVLTSYRSKRTLPSRPSTGPKAHERADLSGWCVLLAEDEMLLAADIEYSLEEAGAQVLGPAGRLRDALAIATDPERQIDAAILDVDLHGQDVFPVADALKERGVPFLFHTAHGTKTGLKDRYADAVVCNKPVMSEDLVGLVAVLLR